MSTPSPFAPQGNSPYMPQGQASFGQAQQYPAYGMMPQGERRPHFGFGQAVKAYFKNYAKFDGRASRSEYWWVTL